MTYIHFLLSYDTNVVMVLIGELSIAPESFSFWPWFFPFGQIHS